MSGFPYITEHMQAMLDQIYKTEPLFFRSNMPPLPPEYGPPLPRYDDFDLEVRIVGDELRFITPGWDAEPAYIPRDELDGLIEFLQAWRK